MQEEIWKDIPDYEGLYQASSLGRIRSLERVVKSVNRHGSYLRTQKPRVLKPMLTGKSYALRLKVHLYKDNKMKNAYIHQLVAESFLDHEKCGMKVVVDHIDNDPLNNKLDNLQLITHRENLSKDKKNKTSKYTGVHWSKSRSKWVAAITINSVKKYLGLFDCESEAHKAYQYQLENI